MQLVCSKVCALGSFADADDSPPRSSWVHAWKRSDVDWCLRSGACKLEGDATATDLETLPNPGESHARGEYSLSELGCSLSHLRAIAQAYHDGSQTALILEDDISLEYVPAKQMLHDAAPSSAATFPSEHAWHDVWAASCWY